MRNLQLRKVLPVSLVLLLILSCGRSAGAQSAALGHGLEQLVQMHETGNPKLAMALKPHLTAADGRLLVHVRLQPGMTAAQMQNRLAQYRFELKAAGAMDSSILEGYIPLASVRGAASVAGVKSIHAAMRPFRMAGSVQSQAVALEKVDKAQARGLDGTGIRIGALSDSYNECGAACSTTAEQDVATGDLPTGVVVFEEDDTSVNGPATDEGRAILQLLHDIAPASTLAFATAFNGEVDFANNILKLRRTFHADVITDDVGYPDEPMYSDGLIAQAVDEVVKEGAAYFSSAGNNGLEAFEDVYRPISFARAQKLVAEGKSNLDLAALVAHGHTPVSVHSFSDGKGGISITQGFTSYAFNQIAFQWDEPFFLGKVQTNFDVYVFDENGHYLDPTDPNAPIFFSTDDNIQTDEPFEFIILPNYTPSAGGLVESKYQLLFANMNGGPARHIKYITVNALGVSERQNAPSVFGHTAARHGQSVGAMYYAIPNFPEDFSSPGPVTIYLDEAGNRLRHPEIRFVPQITAADGVDTTFFGEDVDGDGHPNFFGTSAAAPDAAAVAALVIQGAGGPGSISPEKVYRRLQRTATPVPLSADRTISGTNAGPVEIVAQGDFTRDEGYFVVEVEPFTQHKIKSIAIDVSHTPAPMTFNPNPARFHVGKTQGINATDISATYSADVKTATLAFSPGSLGAKDSFTFGLSVFTPIEGSVQEDPDRFEDTIVTVTLDDNSTKKGKFEVAPKLQINRFTGAGLVNADKATRERDDDR